MGRIYAIALNTFREAIRNRVLYGVLAVVFGLNLFAAVLGDMSFNEDVRVARDVGLGGISFFGSITAIVLGVALLYQEIQRRTIHTIISKPIERWEFVLGKYLGMVATLTMLVVAFTVVMFLVLELRGVGVTTSLVKAVLLAYGEVLIVAAIAIFFSSFSTPFLSGIFTFALFFLGRISEEMKMAAESAQGAAIEFACKLALYIVPDLSTFSISGSEVAQNYVSVHGDSFVTWGYVGVAMGYGALYISALLVLAVLIFSRRDFV